MFQTIITLSREKVNFERKVYNFMDLLGNLGGLTEIFMVTFGFLLIPIAEHAYLVQATKRLFIARTEDDNLFLKPDYQEEGVKPNKYIGDHQHKYDMHPTHRHIRLNRKDEFFHYFANIFKKAF